DPGNLISSSGLAEAIFGKALAHPFDRKDGASERLRGELFGRHELPRGRREHRLEVFSTEADAGRIGDRQRYLPVDAAVGPVPDDAAACEKRSPEAAVDIDAGAVRPLAGFGVVGEDSPVGDGALVEIEVENKAQMASRIGEIQGLAVRRERDAVADDDAGYHPLDRPVGIDPIEAARAIGQTDVHGSDPEPAAPIDTPVIEPSVP